MTSESAFLFAWSLGVLLSWVGWGRLAARWAVGRRRVDSGLCAAWGMAILVAIGGVLNATKLCSRPAVIGLTMAGIALAVPAIVKTFRRAARSPKLALRRLLPTLPVIAGGTFLMLASIGMIAVIINWIDDPSFYMTLPLRMLESGAAEDPLNGRRLLTFGGYAFLQTQVAASGVIDAACVTDLGLANLVVAMLLLGLPRRGGARWAVIGLVLLAWVYPWPRLNTMAGTTLTATVLALWRTVRLADHSRTMRRGRLLMTAALVATAAATFRANVVVLPPAFFALYFADRLARSPEAWRSVAREAATVLFVGVVALAPWSVALYRAAGSLLYPLMAGNQRDPYYSFAGSGMTVADRLGTLGRTLASPAFVLVSLPLIVLAWRRQWTGVWLYAAALVTSAATIWAFPTADPPWLERFCVPTLLAAALVGMDATLRWNRTRAVGAALASAVAGLLMWPGATTVAMTDDYVRATRIVLSGADPLPQLSQARLAYTEAQSRVPPGVTIASATDFPVLFDFGRNPILCVDSPGYATRFGLWPYGKGPDAMRRFLIEQGAEYVAFADFDAQPGMYTRWWWRQAAGRGDRVGPRMLDMMDNLEALWRQSTHVYERDRMRLLRLR